MIWEHTSPDCFPVSYCACCSRAVNEIKSVFQILACHLSLCMLLELRLFADSIPSALAKSSTNKQTPTKSLVKAPLFPGAPRCHRECPFEQNVADRNRFALIPYGITKMALHTGPGSIV